MGRAIKHVFSIGLKSEQLPKPNDFGTACYCQVTNRYHQVICLKIFEALTNNNLHKFLVKKTEKDTN